MVPLDVQVIRQARPRAVQVVLANYMIHWLPRSQIVGGGELVAGQRDFVIEVPGWLADRLEQETPVSMMNFMIFAR